MAENSAEHVAEIAGAAVADVVAASEAAVVAANERAEAAGEVAALLTEAVVQREISGDVEDLENEVEEWRADLEKATNRITFLETTLSEIQQSLTALVTLEMLTLEISKLSSSIQKPLPQQEPETPRTSNPQDGGDALPEAEAEPAKKKYRVS